MNLATHFFVPQMNLGPRLARSSSLGLVVVLLVFASAFFAGEPARAAAARVEPQVTAQQLLDAIDSPAPAAAEASLWPAPAAWPGTAPELSFVNVQPPASVGTSSVPVLMYHYIRVNPVASDDLGFRLSVTPNDFAAQMAYLYAMGVHTVTLHQVFAAYAGGPALPSHPVVLTFDDGHNDFATVAAPILAHYGFVGIDYVVSGFLGRTSYMTAAQVKEVDLLGMTVGAHTVSHVPLAELTPDVAGAEITASKQMLEQLLGHSVEDFAYPYGSYNADDEGLVHAAGFANSVSTNGGLVSPGADRYALPREEVLGGEDLATFAALVSLPPPRPGFTAPTASALIGR